MSSSIDHNSGMHYIDLDSFNPEDATYLINSPRSLEAIGAIGVNVEQLYKKPSSFFIAKYGKTIGQERAKRYEARRSEYVKEATSCRVALISIDSVVGEGKGSNAGDVSSEHVDVNKAPGRPKALNVTFGSMTRDDALMNTEYTCDILKKKPQNYGDTEIQVNPIAREERRVKLQAENEKKIERARIRKSLEEELQMMRSMAMREEEESRKRMVEAESAKFNRRRQANAQRAQSLKEEKETALSLLKKGTISPFEVQGYMKSHESLQDDRYARATQLYLQKEASLIVKDEEIKKEDIRRKNLIKHRQNERVKQLREQRERKTAAIQQAQVHQIKEGIQREKEGEEKRKKGDDAFERAKMRNTIIQKYFQETVHERQSKANENRLKVETTREEKQQRDHEREQIREGEIEKRRHRQREDIELARQNRSQKQNVREEVYMRAELLQSHKENVLTKRMLEADARSQDLMRRRQEELSLKQQRQQMLLDEQQEHIQRVERMQEYKRSKTAERQAFEEERVQWQNAEKERLRENVRRNVTQSVYGGASTEQKAIPEHIAAAARAVAVRFQVSEEESVNIAQDMFQQVQKEDKQVSARPSSAFIAFNPSLTSKPSRRAGVPRPGTQQQSRTRRRGGGNAAINTEQQQSSSSSSSSSSHTNSRKKAATSNNIDDLLFSNNYHQNPALNNQNGVTAKQRTELAWEDVDDQRGGYRRVFHPTYSAQFEKKGSVAQQNVYHEPEAKRVDADYFDTYSRHTLHDPRDEAAFARSGQKKQTSLQAKHSAQMQHMIEQEHQNELKRQGMLAHAPPGNNSRLEAQFASERAQAAAAIQSEQRRQKLDEASLAEALGLEVPHGK